MGVVAILVMWPDQFVSIFSSIGLMVSEKIRF